MLGQRKLNGHFGYELKTNMLVLQFVMIVATFTGALLSFIRTTWVVAILEPIFIFTFLLVLVMIALVYFNTTVILKRVFENEWIRRQEPPVTTKHYLIGDAITLVPAVLYLFSSTRKVAQIIAFALEGLFLVAGVIVFQQCYKYLRFRAAPMVRKVKNKVLLLLTILSALVSIYTVRLTLMFFKSSDPSDTVLGLINLCKAM